MYKEWRFENFWCSSNTIIKAIKQKKIYKKNIKYPMSGGTQDFFLIHSCQFWKRNEGLKKKR